MELFERDDRAGGHSNTVEHMVAGRTRRSTRLHRPRRGHLSEPGPPLPRARRPHAGLRDELLGRLRADNLEYSGRRRRSRGRPSRSRLPAPRQLSARRPALRGLEPARYVAEEGDSPRFRDHFLVPLCAALWSTAPSQTLDIPLVYAVRFFANQGCSASGACAGRRSAGQPDHVRARRAAAINLVTEGARSAASTAASSCDSRATSCGASTASWSRPTPTRRCACSRIRARTSAACSACSGRPRTTPSSTPTSASCPAALDPRLMELPAARLRPRRGRPTMTYYLNKLQRLDEDEHYCVTLNRTAEIDPARIIRRFSYRHPLVTHESMRAQPELPRLNGRGHRLRRRLAGLLLPRGRPALRPRRRSGVRSEPVRSALYTGTVMHARRRRRRTSSATRVLLPTRPRRATRTPPAPAAVRLEPKERGQPARPRPPRHPRLPGRARIEADRILLLTNLRVLGYVFNPVSFCYCYQGGELACIVALFSQTPCSREVNA